MKTFWVTFLLILSVTFNASLYAKEYDLSKRTIEQYKVFMMHVDDAKERQNLANILMVIVNTLFHLAHPY